MNKVLFLLLLFFFWGGGIPIERFRSRGQHICKFMKTKEIVKKEFNSLRICLKRQPRHRDVMWKRSIRGKHMVMKMLQNSLFFSLQKLCWAVWSWCSKQRCLYYRPWQYWNLSSILRPNNSRWGVDCLPKETGRLGKFLPWLGWLQTRFRKSEWWVLARIGQDTPPDKRTQQASGWSGRLGLPNSLRWIRLIWCWWWTEQVQAGTSWAIRW